ncbi:MAG: hypothetical protein JOZ17_05345 [Acetobacteraceae bacterium]|nr:hypothetical protein [Acetobacteraceae bacterium]
MTIIDLHHPLYGKRLKLLSLACARGAGFVAVALDDGRRRLVRRSATDLDHAAAMEPAMPRISARVLLPLARQVRRMLTASQEETPHAEPALSAPLSPTVSGGSPAVVSATVAGPAVANPDAVGAAACAPAAAAASIRGDRPC